jgi:hypothetical protein
VEQLLVEVVADGFTMYCCGPKAAPHALVAAYEWDNYVDLLTIGDFNRVTTARVPTRDTVDIFAPKVVVWAYEGSPQRALRAVLKLSTDRGREPGAHPSQMVSTIIPRRVSGRVRVVLTPSCSVGGRDGYGRVGTSPPSCRRITRARAAIGLVAR